MFWKRKRKVPAVPDDPAVRAIPRSEPTVADRLLAPWLVEHCLKTELDRSRRFDFWMAVIIVWRPHMSGILPGQEAMSAATSAVHSSTRIYDAVGQIMPGVIAVVLPQTDEVGAEFVKERIEAELASRTDARWKVVHVLTSRGQDNFSDILDAIRRMTSHEPSPT